MSPKSEGDRPRRYPAQASERTSFVGRDDDLDDLARLFEEGAQLVSLVGPPGIGKTRLALRFFRGWEQGKRGAFFCDVREAANPRDLAGAVARELSAESLSGSAEGEWVDQLGAMLEAHDQCLLVLDNFEQLAPVAATTIGRWLALAPRLRVLVTSRRVLRLTGEHVRDLTPLTVPVGECERGGPELNSEALRLFVGRARAMASFDWDRASDMERVSTVRLVRRLEGIPLALELAAGQMRRSTPQQLEAKLERELLAIASVCADADPRHTTLRAAIEGSWQLLTNEERSALCQLTVFRGGLSVAGAKAVLRLDAVAVEDVFFSLRDASLLRASADGQESRLGRWEMYSSIREFAEEKLAATPGERREALTRHATFFAREASNQLTRFETKDENAARRSLKEDVANLEAAFRWISQSAHHFSRLDVYEVALALNAVYERALPGRAAEWISHSLEESTCEDNPSEGDETEVCRLRLLLSRARAWREVGEYELAMQDLDAAASSLAALPSSNPRFPVLESLAHFERGIVAFKRGEIEGARESLERACEISERAGALRLSALAWTRLGFLAAEALGDPVAFEHYECALRLARRSDDQRTLLLTTHCFELHKVHFARRTSAASQHAVVTAARELGERWLEANGWLALGLFWHDRAEFDQTLDCYRKGEAAARRAGLKYTVASALLLQALLADSVDKPNEALALLDEAAMRYQLLGALRVEGWVRVVRSGILAGVEDATSAEREWNNGYQLLAKGRDRALLEAASIHRGRLDVARARRAMSEGRFDESERCRKRVQSLLEVVNRAKPSRERQMAADLAPVDRSIAARLAARRLRLDLARLQTDGGVVLRVAVDGSSFRIGSQKAVSFARGSVIRRALVAFARARRESPGRPLNTLDLLTSCWPGETPIRDSGETRVRGVVRRLRRAGLEALLVTTEHGYLLDPTVDLSLVDSDYAEL